MKQQNNNPRALHNAKTVGKKSDFCFQPGGKAEFMICK